MNFLKKICLLLVGISVSPMGQAAFQSPIFMYDDSINAKNLHTCIKGNNWEAREVIETDLPFYVDLFGNPQIMQTVAEGHPRSSTVIEQRIRNEWLPYSQNGHPQVALTIFNEEGPFGYVGLFAHTPGKAEIGYAYHPSSWGKGLASDILQKVVNDWGPEVRRIGRGEGLDPLQNRAIITAFQCFEGQPLESLYATAKPSNPGSIRVLEKTGFHPIVLKEPGNILTIPPKSIQNYAQLEHYLHQICDPSTAIYNPIYQKDTLYPLIDPHGKHQTWSYVSEYKSIRLHFERSIE